MPSGGDMALGPLGAAGKLGMMPVKPQGSSHKAGNPPWVQRVSAEGKAGETVMRREAWPTALQDLPSQPSPAGHPPLWGFADPGAQHGPEGTPSSPASPLHPLGQEGLPAPWSWGDVYSGLAMVSDLFPLRIGETRCSAKGLLGQRGRGWL